MLHEITLIPPHCTPEPQYTPMTLTAPPGPHLIPPDPHLLFQVSLTSPQILQHFLQVLQLVQVKEHN